MKEYRLRLGSREIPIRRTLQDAKPSTFVDGGGNRNKNRWQQQEISRDQLLKYKEVRESGGPIAAILQASGLLTFGTGTKWDVEDEGLEEWLNENIPTRELDLFAIQAGTDAHTYPGVPVEIVETRGGDFSHFECVEPWTIIPQTDNHGDIVGFEQVVKVNGETKRKRMEEDELGYIVINRSSGRDKTGVSLLQQNMDEIEHYVETREATKNSAQLHGFPQRQIRVGREGMSPPNDQELRRIRQRFSRTWDELTMFVTGRDVEIDTLEATDFDFQGLTEDSLKTLMLSFLLPQELANVGSDGLGSGMPAELRRELLNRGIEAKQRDFAGQFVDQLVKPVVEEYSPHNPEDINKLKFKQPLEDEQDELERLERKINIGEKAAKNGLDVRFEAGDIEIESGEFDPDAGGEQPGGLDQIFNAEGNGSRELAEIPEKYTDGTGLSEDDFVPNESILDVIEPTMQFIDEHGLPNPDDQQEGAARINQLHDHIVNNNPLAVAFWKEIHDFHKRHRAQDNHICDESTLPEKATEIDNSEFDKCHFDNGWFSDRTWGGDPAFEQAKRVVEAIEDTEGVELAEDTTVPVHFRAGGSGNSYSAGCACHLADGGIEVDLDKYPDWERELLDFELRCYDKHPDGEKQLSFSSSALPEFAKENLRQAVLSGAIFPDIEGAGGADLRQFKEFLIEQFEGDQFNVDAIADRLEDLGGGFENPSTVARTELGEVAKTARQFGYSEDGRENDPFYWTGNLGDRTTDTCKYLIAGFDADLENAGAFTGLDRPDGTNPNQGGKPIEGLQNLQDHVHNVAEADPAFDTNPRGWTPHIACRKSFVRHIE